MNTANKKKLNLFLQEQERNTVVKVVTRKKGVESWWLKEVELEIDKIITNDYEYYIRCENSNKKMLDCVTSKENITEIFSDHIRHSELVKFDFVKLPSKTLKPDKTLILMK